MGHLTLRPTPVVPPETAADDPRVGHLLGRQASPFPLVCLIGFPSDEGVRRNGGRVGAAAGPTAIREALYRMTPDPRRPALAALLERVRDRGDVPVTGDLEADQEALGAEVMLSLVLGTVPVVLGGGHETAFGHFLGYAEAQQPPALLNFDAHADVRPLREGRAHSGSPFRQALEYPSPRCRGYTVAGLQPQSVSAAHLAYLHERGARAIFADELDRAALDALFDALDGPTLVTFDLDALDAAFAPGVSAPAAAGLTPDVWFHAAYRAGQSAHVRSIDVSELCPRYDVDGRTARVAALTVWHFLRGLSERPPWPVGLEKRPRRQGAGP